MKAKLLKQTLLSMCILLLFSALSSVPLFADSPTTTIQPNTLEILNKETGQSISLDACTSQEYKVLDYDDFKLLTNTSSKDLYAVDVTAEVKNRDLVDIGLYTSHESTNESWLDNNSVKLWGRFFYERSGNYVLVTRVTGNWRNYETNRQYISFQSAQASCCNEYNVQQINQWYPSGGFTYDTSFTEYINLNTAPMMLRVGLFQSLTIERYSGETYDLYLWVAPWGWNW